MAEARVRTAPLPDCEECKGTGKIGYRTPADPTPRVLVDGTTITQGEGWGTRPCKCVRELPAIEGQATWWGTETVWERVVECGVFPDDLAELTVRPEVPYAENGMRVHRRGNRYFGTHVDAMFPTSAWLMPDDARRLALALLAAAEAADAIDNPDLDECGHWWPCDCRTRATEGTEDAG